MSFYFCLHHDRVEQGKTCRATSRMGPYDSREAAENWRDRVEARNEAWKAQDERWHGTDDDG